MTIASDAFTLPAPDAEASAHSARLSELIRAEIVANDGAISFLEFMELALYAPELGYYRAGARKFGKSGDFVTAPEISPLFSRCVARQCQQVLVQLGSGDMLELGAGSGIMAADILAELERLDCLPENYYILELSGELRQRQQQTLVQRVPTLAARVTWLDKLPKAGFRGVIVGNEILDALPVERFCITPQGARPLWVTWRQDRFEWCEGSADDALTAAVAAIETRLDGALPLDFASEYNPRLPAWLASLAERLAAGVILLIDYGYPRREYYHPQRTNGTLLCHYRHRAHADPLIMPGLQDITASVDFTAVAEAGVAAGLTLAGYTSQQYFLFGCGLEEMLVAVDPGDTVGYAKLMQQVKWLTLPGEMGERFKAIALTRGVDGVLCGFDVFDERGRL